MQCPGMRAGLRAGNALAVAEALASGRAFQGRRSAGRSEARAASTLFGSNPEACCRKPSQAAKTSHSPVNPKMFLIDSSTVLLISLIVGLMAMGMLGLSRAATVQVRHGLTL